MSTLRMLDVRIERHLVRNPSEDLNRRLHLSALTSTHSWGRERPFRSLLLLRHKAISYCGPKVEVYLPSTLGRAKTVVNRHTSNHILTQESRTRALGFEGSNVPSTDRPWKGIRWHNDSRNRLSSWQFQGLLSLSDNVLY
jgi:hypothetical protein